MGFYRGGSDRPEVPSFSERTRAPASWGGIGCVLALLLPVMAYGAAWLTLTYNARYHWLIIPPELARSLGGLPLSGALLVLMVGYGVLFYAFYAAVYALLYGLTGLSPYTVLDTDRPERRGRRRAPWGALVGPLLAGLSVVGTWVLLRANAQHHWFPIPPSWQVPGPFPLAGVAFFVFVVLLVLFWTLWSLLQVSVASWKRKHAPPREDEFRW